MNIERERKKEGSQNNQDLNEIKLDSTQQVVSRRFLTIRTSLVVLICSMNKPSSSTLLMYSSLTRSFMFVYSQVSHVTYKLLGMECPVPNRYQSRVPDLTNIAMPLTDSESRHQRAMALAAAKSSASNQLDEMSTVGTAVNPRERPRGMMAPSGSLLNFNSTTSRAIPMVAPPPLNAPVPPTVVAPLPLPTQIRSSHQRSGSAAQLMFDDDFSQFPTHALSLTNIPQHSRNDAESCDERRRSNSNGGGDIRTKYVACKAIATIVDLCGIGSGHSETTVSSSPGALVLHHQSTTSADNKSVSTSPQCLTNHESTYLSFIAAAAGAKFPRPNQVQRSIVGIRSIPS